ncbi:hypothetical protein [Kaarinaea lacus]
MNKIKYIEATLNFYFEGDFEKTIGKLGDDANALIERWFVMAKVFEKLSENVDLNIKEKNDLFSLVEEACANIAVDSSMGESIRNVDLSDLGEGYDIDEEFYKKWKSNVITVAKNIYEELTKPSI